VLDANGPHAPDGDDGITARTTAELQRLAGQIDADEEPS